MIGINSKTNSIEQVTEQHYVEADVLFMMVRQQMINEEISDLVEEGLSYFIQISKNKSEFLRAKVVHIKERHVTFQLLDFHNYLYRISINSLIKNRARVQPLNCSEDFTGKKKYQCLTKINRPQMKGVVYYIKSKSQNK